MTPFATVIEHVLKLQGTRPDDIAFFIKRLDQYRYLARAPVTIRPPSVAGQHMSVRLMKGWRLWGFETLVDRDKFVIQHHNEAFIFPDD